MMRLKPVALLHKLAITHWLITLRCRTVFKTAIEATGLSDALYFPEAGFTFLVPSDEALQRACTILGVNATDLLSNVTLEPSQRRTLRTIVQYHVLPSKQGLSSFTNEQVLPTFLTQSAASNLYCTNPDVTLRADVARRVGPGYGIMFASPGGSAAVSRGDFQGCSSFLHLINSVLMPCCAASAGTIDKLATLDGSTNLTSSPSAGNMLTDRECFLPLTALLVPAPFS